MVRTQPKSRKCLARDSEAFTELNSANLAESPRKLDLPEEVPRWLLAVGPHGLRLKDIRVALHASNRKQYLLQLRSGALVRLSQDMRSVLLVGTSEAKLAARRMTGWFIVLEGILPYSVAAKRDV